MNKINTFTKWKNGWVDASHATIMCTIPHQKYFAQSGRSTRSALYIFNKLHVFTLEPIRGREIKFACMNDNCSPVHIVSVIKLWTTEISLRFQLQDSQKLSLYLIGLLFDVAYRLKS